MSTENKQAPASTPSRNVQALNTILNAARLAPLPAKEHETLLATAQGLAQNITNMEAALVTLTEQVNAAKEAEKPAAKPGPKRTAKKA